MTKMRLRSLVILVLIFFLSLGIPFLTTQVSLSSPSMVEQGKERYQAGDYQEALTLWQQAAEAFAAQGDSLNQAMALSNLSLTYQQLGQWREAKQSITESLNILKSQGKTVEKQKILASTLDIQGKVQLTLGESSAALETWQQASNIYTQINNYEGETRSRINQAQAMQDLGLYPRACQTLLKVLELEDQDCQISKGDLQVIQQGQNHPWQVLALRSLGNILRVLGKTEQSQMVLLTSWQLAQQLQDYQSISAIYLSLGNTAHALGNQKIAQKQYTVISQKSVNCLQEVPHDNASDFYQQAADCYQQAQLSASGITKIQAQLNLLSLLVKTQQWDEIKTLYSEIQANLAQLPPTRATVAAQLKLDQNLICLKSRFNQNQWEHSSPIWQQCNFVGLGIENEVLSRNMSEISSWQEIESIAIASLNQARSLEDKQAEANALGYLASIYQQMGKPAEAQQLTIEALQLLSGVDAPDITYLWQWQLARLYQSQAKYKEALQTYNLAVETLQSLRQDLVITNPDLQFTFRDSVEPVYRELVDLLLAAKNPTQDNLKQARNMIEGLQLAELNNFFQEACLDTKREYIDQLDPKAAVIYAIVLPKRLAVILSLHGKPLRYYETALAINAREKDIELVFDDLFANLNPFISSPEPLQPHQQFYDWLIRPSEAELESNNIKTLVFVLDGVLRGVPMAALHDGQQYLIEKYNLALTPGLQLFNPHALSPEKLKTLIGGLAEARQGFSALPAVKHEINKIAEVVPTEVLLDMDFTRRRLETEIEETSFPIVHLATHGQFSSQAEDTFLLTWDENINVKDLDQLLQGSEPHHRLRNSREERNPIELLILSACQTAVGDKRATLGLAGVAVRSGARSTLATLWSVQDQSTAELMNHFYSALNQPGVTKAEALRQAQLSLLKTPLYQHPFYWAPFVLVGNWF